MKTRNPVAGNAHRYNRAKVYVDRKKQERKVSCRSKKEFSYG